MFLLLLHSTGNLGKWFWSEGLKATNQVTEREVPFLFFPKVGMFSLFNFVLMVKWPHATISLLWSAIKTTFDDLTRNLNDEHLSLRQ